MRHFFEETFDICNYHNRPSVVRRFIGLVICDYRCKMCYPEFFENIKNYEVVYNYKPNSNIEDDPLFVDFIEYLKSIQDNMRSNVVSKTTIENSEFIENISKEIIKRHVIKHYD